MDNTPKQSRSAAARLAHCRPEGAETEVFWLPLRVGCAFFISSSSAETPRIWHS